MSRRGAVAYLVATLDQFVFQHKEAATDGERRELQQRIDSLKQLTLDVRAGRIDAFAAPGVVIVIKD
ncbi:hypothetical protein FAZ69_31480 [Trinickia terrae]|uniref:Uncharacterized protein n=1 Tax=Trinickia terrae TaxID=2571161 RepID=A0A4U1HDJ3_9BURK|nr:hypothetical protein [Trinickia terrae]TKC78962.1 hypothetical protein FAZ69_31480 [Trinickia terrae]